MTGNLRFTTWDITPNGLLDLAYNTTEILRDLDKNSQKHTMKNSREITWCILIITMLEVNYISC
jgi:hypothetical protein